MNRKIFFDHIRGNVFKGKLTQSQVDGCNKILDYHSQKWPYMSLVELSYVLATTYWETAAHMQPVIEKGSLKYLKARKYWPYIGTGLIQVTWKKNYDKFGFRVPEDGLDWDHALDALFRGMIFGLYTGKRLSDYFGHGKEDSFNARKIVNGTDKAQQISEIYKDFKEALLLAEEDKEEDNATVS